MEFDRQADTTSQLAIHGLVEEKSTSVEGTLIREDIGEDIASSRTSRKKECERTQEWWEGYDPGMDSGF